MVAAIAYPDIRIILHGVRLSAVERMFICMHAKGRSYHKMQFKRRVQQHLGQKYI